MVAQAVFQQRDVDDGGVLGDTNSVAELADRLRRVAAPAESCNRGHARVVPAVHIASLYKAQQAALAEYGMAQVEARELYLARLVHAQLLQEPVVQRAVVLVLHSADGVRDALDGVRLTVREVVHRVDAPVIACAVVLSVKDAIHHRVAHVEVG